MEHPSHRACRRARLEARTVPMLRGLARASADRCDVRHDPDGRRAPPRRGDSSTSRAAVRGSVSRFDLGEPSLVRRPVRRGCEWIGRSWARYRAPRRSRRDGPGAGRRSTRARSGDEPRRGAQRCANRTASWSVRGSPSVRIRGRCTWLRRLGRPWSRSGEPPRRRVRHRHVRRISWWSVAFPARRAISATVRLVDDV